MSGALGTGVSVRDVVGLDAYGSPKKVEAALAQLRMRAPHSVDGEDEEDGRGVEEESGSNDNSSISKQQESCILIANFRCANMQQIFKQTTQVRTTPFMPLSIRFCRYFPKNA